VLAALIIIVVAPAMLIFLSRLKWYPTFYKLARLWGRVLLIGMGYRWTVTSETQLEKGRNYMFIGNHTSMLDPMLMLDVVKHNPIVFVGKQELEKIPIFGYFYRKSCILVDRATTESRINVYPQAQARLDAGFSIGIFPEGGVPDESVDLDDFKNGAFRLAIQYQIPIVPLIFVGPKKLFSFTFFSGGPGKLSTHVMPIIETKGMTNKDLAELKKTTRELMLREVLKRGV
jgi:1-acyl-sn-glycerol-3-phosphate acyltransferase